MSATSLFSSGKSFKSQWDGYYEQDGTEYRFRAEFLHEENTFRGRIIDSDRIYSRLVLDDYLDLSMVSQAVRAEYKQKLARSLNCSNPDSIEITREQTDKALVEGEIENNTISFLKTYESGVVITFSTRNNQFNHQTPPYSILYEGTLSTDGNTIEGTWLLNEEKAGVVLKGSFSMHRL